MKRFVSILLVALLLATVCFVGYKTDGFKNWKVVSNEVTKENTEESGGALVSGATESGVALKTTKIPQSMFSASGISDNAESAFDLVATVTPNGATYVDVDWDIYFVDSSSTWATGKDVEDYVTITPTADGALTATLECLQPFGEQVEVKVTSRDTATATATCTVDYLEKLLSTNVKFFKPDNQKTYLFNQSNTTNLVDFAESYGPPFTVSVTYDKTIGTIADEYATTVTYGLSDALYNSCRTNGVNLTVHKSNSLALNSNSSGVFDKIMFNNIFFVTNGTGSWNFSSYRAKIATLLNSYQTSKNAVELKVKTVGTTDTYYSNYAFSINPSSIAVHVSNVTLDHSELVF